jgi:hypothetical protein
MATHAPITGAPLRAPITFNTIARFCESNRIALTRFGREAAGDPGLVFALRDDRALRPATIAKIEAFMRGRSTHVRRVSRGTCKRPADDFAVVARRHREAMSRGSAMLLQAIHRARKEG